LHGRQDLHDLKPLYIGFAEMPLVSISNHQRDPVAHSNFIATVHHGIPVDLLEPSCHAGGGYLAFLGRISPEKRLDRAIRIARAAGLALKVAAKVDRADQDYYDQLISPLILGNPLVDYIGEISDRDKSEFLSGAITLLVPIDWPEPFGLVMIEAMACGTPVIAFNRGSAPEVVDDGITGFIVEDVGGAIGAVDRLGHLSRERVRRRFEERFTVRRMAQDYLSVYRSLMTVTEPHLRLVADEAPAE